MSRLLLVLALVLSCLSFAWAGRIVRDVPARVEAEGHRVRMRIEGRGSPAVVLEIGLGGPLEEWATVQPEVAAFTQVVAYDRLGSQHTGQLTGEDIARELHAALANAHVHPPYILVGQSFAGIYNRIYASRYPAEVRGMVLLDPSQEEFIDWMEEHHPGESPRLWDTREWPEGAGVLATLEELKRSGPLPQMPVIVVTGTRPGPGLRNEILPVWTAMHETWVHGLPQGRHILAEKSGHAVQVDQPQLVVGIIRQVVDEARQKH